MGLLELIKSFKSPQGREIRILLLGLDNAGNLSDFEKIYAKFNQTYTREASFEELYHLFEQIKQEVLEQWGNTESFREYKTMFSSHSKQIQEKEIEFWSYIENNIEPPLIKRLII